MSVREYAQDINMDVEVVLKKAIELGYAKSADDVLSEDAVIDLDNVLIIRLEENDDDTTYIDEIIDEKDYDLEEELEDKAEELASSSHLKFDDTVKKQKLKKKSEISKEDINAKRKQMYKNKEKLTQNEASQKDNVVIYKDAMTVSDLAKELDVPATEIIKKLMNLGIMASLNNSLSFDDVEMIVIDYDKTLKSFESQDKTNFEKFEINDDEKDLKERPAVVTIMGHVDHGKTSLLDYIRHSHITTGEFGGITQHIGAYQIENNGKKITFIDTPGHAAFTEMRARGASVTDIVIIIVAADDGVMPQTEEAIDHAKAAGVPIIVAINKIDKPGANPEKVMTEMATHDLTPEQWGGDVIYTNISALTGEGIDKLLDNIQLVSEMQELKANPNRYALGTVIESKLDKNVGSTVTLLVQNGTLRLGDPIVVGTSYGKVRTLKDDLGREVMEAGPSTPVEITGLSEVPSSGDRFMAFETEKEAKTIAENRKLQAKLKNSKVSNAVSIDDLFNKIQSGIKEINVVLKTDVKGTEEAVKNALSKIEVEGVRVKVIRSGVGTITESDIVLANASSALIVGFNVRPSSKTMEVAKEYNVDIRLHNIIYKLVEEMEAAMKGMLDPEYEEKVIGEAEVRKLFKFSKVGTIAGSMVTSGVIKSNSKARLMRDGIVIYDGEINSLQKEKDQVKEVKKGFECGITLLNYSDIKENDVIEAYEMIEIKR
ncbi:MAG: translation initiation factor IF-2 [Bacilli bacterium]|nr:translation initiation factor IF-2 [Bacilli bacterium]MBP3635472.1 translation initiation factor IF-2 [Bacilli bacterium]